MSHSTHTGFSCPVITFTPWLWRPSQRFAVGVGHNPRSTALTITVSDVIVLRGPPGIRAFMAKCASGVLPSSCATGVGHNEDPLAYMGGTDEARRYAIPFRVIPERGQLSEYVSHPERSESWGVLHEDVPGS